MTLFVKVFITCKEFKECLVGMILGRIEKNEWKIGEKIGGTWERCLVGRGEGRKKWWGLVIISPGPPKLDFSKFKR